MEQQKECPAHEFEEFIVGDCICDELSLAYKRGKSEAEEAIARVRELHYKDAGLCGYCQDLANPDDDSTNWYMVYYPCPTIKALDGEQ